jgi:hypothetical protein
MIVKIISLPAFGAVALIINITKLVVTALKVAFGAAMKIYQTFFKLD